MNANFGKNKCISKLPKKISTPRLLRTWIAKKTAKRTVDGPNEKQSAKSQLPQCQKMSYPNILKLLRPWFGLQIASRWRSREVPGCHLGSFVVIRQNPIWHQSRGMVTLTFFLWEVNQKFFFLPWGFNIQATRKNNFCHPVWAQWGHRSLLAHFRAKWGYFETIFYIKNNVCVSVCLSHPRAKPVGQNRSSRAKRVGSGVA